ncbi:MAG: hypothetical protein ACOX19_06320 [Fermentimonas sp.]|jgi:DNA polymerase V
MKKMLFTSAREKNRLFNPTLKNCPVVVLSNNDGCVIVWSNEAKRLGIPMGAPAFEYRYTFERHRVTVFSANFPLYGDISQRVMNILATYSPNWEVYSIDECFLDLSGIEPLREYGLEMRARVNRWVGIPISVGIAPTKTLAKAANRIAKWETARATGQPGREYPQDVPRAAL